jgi:hypothetical protein
VNGESEMAPFRGNDDEEEDDNLFDAVSAMADRMGLSGEKRSNYIDDHMTQAGYQRIQSRDSYARIREQDDEDESGGNRWFGSSGRGRERGRGQGSGGPRNPRRGGDDGDSF